MMMMIDEAAGTNYYASTLSYPTDLVQQLYKPWYEALGCDSESNETEPYGL